jgi:hypothetical protein
MGIENEFLDLDGREELARQRVGNFEYEHKQNLEEQHRAKLRLQWKGDTKITTVII